MRAGALVLVVAAAGLVAGVALGAQPAWRVADYHRSLQIGLRVGDIGAGWSDAGARRSPYKVDVGSAMSSTLTEDCQGAAPATKAAVDLEVTGGSESTFAGGATSIFSLAMLFKTSTVARMQMPQTGIVGLRSCLRSELQQGFGRAAKVTVLSIARRRIDTGSASSYAFRLVAKVGATGLSERLYVDVVAEQGGRGIVETAYFAVNAPPAATLESRVSHVSAGRLTRYAG